MRALEYLGLPHWTFTQAQATSRWEERWSSLDIHHTDESHLYASLGDLPSEGTLAQCMVTNKSWLNKLLSLPFEWSKLLYNCGVTKLATTYDPTSFLLKPLKENQKHENSTISCYFHRSLPLYNNHYIIPLLKWRYQSNMVYIKAIHMRLHCHLPLSTYTRLFRYHLTAVCHYLLFNNHYSFIKSRYHDPMLFRCHWCLILVLKLKYTEEKSRCPISALSTIQLPSTTYNNHNLPNI